MEDRTDILGGSERTWVVVLNYCGEAHIRECLDSLMQIAPPPGGWKPLLVDNASTDGSLAKARRHFPEIEIIEVEKNLGYAGGNNLGIQHAIEAGAEYVVVLNMDTRVDPSWLVELVNWADAIPEAALLGSLILTGDGEQVEFDGRQFDPVTTSGGYAFVPYLEKAGEEPRDSPYACGAAMLMKATALKKVGVFDPTFFAYHEDVDLSLRCWLQGYRVLIVPGSVVYHTGGGGGAGDAFRDFMGARNSLLTILKVFDGDAWRPNAEALVNHFLREEDPVRLQAVLSGLFRAPEALRHRRHLSAHAKHGYGQMMKRLRGML